MKSRIKLTKIAGFLGLISIIAMIIASCTQNEGGIKSISPPTIVSVSPSDGMVNVDNDTTGQFILDSFSESYQPEYILVAGFCAIVALEVWNSLLMPSWAILTGSNPSI